MEEKPDTGGSEKCHPSIQDDVLFFFFFAKCKETLVSFVQKVNR